MNKTTEKSKMRIPSPVLAGIISVICIITIICTTVAIDKHSQGETPTSTSSLVQSNTSSESAQGNEIDEETSSTVESTASTSSKATESTVSTSPRPFTPQSDGTPTDVNGKVCYLTFDDGPSENTLKIMDILKKYNVKATFFVTGSGNLSYTKRMVAEGHTVALHCNSHEYSKVYASSTAYYNDLNTLSDKVEKACGVRSNIVRFPGGTSNTASKTYCPGLMSKLAKEMPQLGYYYFDWNVDSGDANGNNVSVSRLVANVKTSQRNVVVLMHDTAAKKTTVQALPQIIEYYLNAGYYLAALSPSSQPVRHSPNN